MLLPYELMEQLLSTMESHITEQVTINDLAERFSILAVHLQRLFRFAYGIPLAGYIRSRKLAASAEKLLQTDYRIIDLAYEYGFSCKQTCIRAFKKEYIIMTLMRTWPAACMTPSVPLRTGKERNMKP